MEVLTKKLLKGGKKDVEQVKKKKRHMRIQIQEQVKSFIKSTAVCVFGELLYVLSSYGVEGRRLYEDFII